MTYDAVMNYEYDEGVTQEVLPFAFTGGGDPWVFIENGTDEPYIGRYYHPEEDGEYCAENMAGAILLNMIEFAAEPAVWLDEDGNIKGVNYSEEQMQDMLKEYCRVYDGLLPQAYLEVIHQLSMLHFKACTYNNHGHWLALLSNDEEEALIKRYLDFEHMGESFAWYLDDRE